MTPGPIRPDKQALLYAVFDHLVQGWRPVLPSSYVVDPHNFNLLTERFNLDPEALFEETALYVATRYADGDFDFATADGAINFLRHARETQTGQALPPRDSLFHAVYSAFDAREYHHRQDKTDDPEQEHTRPWIVEILSRYRQTSD